MILDTHILIWLALEPGQIPADARRALIASPDVHRISVASLWEFEIKRTAGRLPDIDFALAIERFGFLYLPINETDALRAARLPLHHKDPFDRMVIAQALERGLTIVTRDRAFAYYDAPILWA